MDPYKGKLPLFSLPCVTFMRLDRDEVLAAFIVRSRHADEDLLASFVFEFAVWWSVWVEWVGGSVIGFVFCTHLAWWLITIEGCASVQVVIILRQTGGLPWIYSKIASEITSTGRLDMYIHDLFDNISVGPCHVEWKLVRPTCVILTIRCHPGSKSPDTVVIVLSCKLWALLTIYKLTACFLFKFSRILVSILNEAVSDNLPRLWVTWTALCPHDHSENHKQLVILDVWIGRRCLVLCNSDRTHLNNLIKNSILRIVWHFTLSCI